MQGVSLSSASGPGTSISCHFLQNSPAKGCLVELTCTQTGLKHSVQIQKNLPAETTGTAIATPLEPCFYNVEVFDIEADGSVSQFAAIVDSLLVTETLDTFLPTTSPSTRGGFYTHLSTFPLTNEYIPALCDYM